tara:strand:+ start:3227 stop:3667 length:441 start_codon:yes stop_codon:yes gene_type:complete
MKIFAIVYFFFSVLIGQMGGLPYPLQNYVNLKKPRLIHYPENPIFIGQKHNIDFITDIPKDSILSASLFFRTDSLINFQEISLDNKNGLYRFTYSPIIFPGKSIEYYLVLQNINDILYASPLNSKGKLSPMRRSLKDPKIYYKNKK